MHGLTLLSNHLRPHPSISWLSDVVASYLAHNYTLADNPQPHTEISHLTRHLGLPPSAPSHFAPRILPTGHAPPETGIIGAII